MTPKSILLMNRKNLEWLNEKLIPYMHTKYKANFYVIGADDKKDIILNWLSDNDNFYGASALELDADKEIYKSEELIYDRARSYEKKYNVTFLRDSILQDREFALNFIHIVANNPLSKDLNLSFTDIIKRQNYFFNFAEKIFKEKKIDLVICRPDSLLGFAITTIAKYCNIPVTIQASTRIDGYMYWTYGAYMEDKQIKKYIRDAIKNNIQPLIEKEKTASHSFKDRQNLIKALSIRSLINEIIYILKDRLNWLLKDIKRGKLGKRIPIYQSIQFKITKYKEHKFFQNYFESNLKKICERPFLYFPLPTEPEYSTHSLSKEFVNTYAMIQQVAISLPIGYRLVIKEHTPNVGARTRDFYTRLGKIPNIINANYLISGPELIDHCKAVVTIAGSSAIEAAERGKKAVVFASSSEFLCLSNIILAHSLRDLPEILRNAITPFSNNEIENIKREAGLLKSSYREIGYYAPGTALFHGKNTEIESDQLEKAVKGLIEVWKLQKQ